MQIYCIIGDERVSHAKSPAIFSALLKRLGIKGAYVPFKVAPHQIGQALHSIKVLNIAGANVAVPYKEAVIPHLDILSEGANIIGAINTIICKGDELKGYNTNAIGFMDTLHDVGFDADGKSALVFGTGGVAKAVVFILNWMRTESIIVAGRDAEKTRQIVNRFSGEAQSINALSNRPLAVKKVVNATSVSSPDESPEMAAMIERLKVQDCELVLDLNYGRSQNIWRDMARRNDIPFMDGLSTLAHQVKRTFFLWTGIQVPPEDFLKVINANL
jgi:shikimate dehydrogenase